MNYKRDDDLIIPQDPELSEQEKIDLVRNQAPSLIDAIQEACEILYNMYDNDELCDNEVECFETLKKWSGYNEAPASALRPSSDRTPVSWNEVSSNKTPTWKNVNQDK